MSEEPDDPTARNRAVHPRKGYDREALGAQFTRRWGLVMSALLVGVTVLLVALLVSG